MRVKIFGILAILLFFTSSAYPAGFELKKTATGYEPESYEPLVKLPGTNMRAGTFNYVLDDKGDRTMKAGVLAGNSIYYVGSVLNERTLIPEDGMKYYDGFDPGGDTHFGVYKDYLVMDSSSYGASHNRMMYLFRFGKDTVELLDVFVKGGSMDFQSAYAGGGKKQEQVESSDKPVLMAIDDFDGDGRPEIDVVIFRGHHRAPDFDLKIFELYLEIKDNGLQVDFKKDLYRPLFEKEKRRKLPREISITLYHLDPNPPSPSRWHVLPEEKREVLNPKGKSDAYYIYAFLSGETGLEEIRSVLKSGGELYKGQYENVVPVLESRGNWNSKFHNYYGQRPVLKKYMIGM